MINGVTRFGNIKSWANYSGNNYNAVKITVPKETYLGFNGLIFSRYGLFAFAFQTNSTSSIVNLDVKTLAGTNSPSTSIDDMTITLSFNSWNGFNILLFCHSKPIDDTGIKVEIVKI